MRVDVVGSAIELHVLDLGRGRVDHDEFLGLGLVQEQLEGDAVDAPFEGEVGDGAVDLHVCRLRGV